MEEEGEAEAECEAEPEGDGEADSEGSVKGDSEHGEEDDPSKPEDGETGDDLKPRPLHRTASIFLRNLAPAITKQEVEAVSTTQNVNLCFSILLRIDVHLINMNVYFRCVRDILDS